jgi:hypothetical protein
VCVDPSDDSIWGKGGEGEGGLRKGGAGTPEVHFVGISALTCGVNSVSERVCGRCQRERGGEPGRGSDKL